MSLHTQECLVVLNEKNQPISIDLTSGGYPFFNNFYSFGKWGISEIEEAQKYASHFKNYRVVRCSVRIIFDDEIFEEEGF